MSDDFKEIITNNIPLLDEMNYYLKKIALNCIIKNKDEGDKYETTESAFNFGAYVECLQGRGTFHLFKYTAKDYAYINNLNIPGLYCTKQDIELYLEDPYSVPKNIQDILAPIKVNDILNNYVELNDYYRILAGLPPLNDRGPLITQSDIVSEDIYNKINLGDGKYTDELSSYEIALLQNFGIIDYLLEKYPQYKYLNYLGERSIDPYISRRAPNFGILYLPTDIETIVSTKFKEKYEKNRVYVLKTIYSEAYKYGSDYYDRFIQMFILIETMVDMIVEIPEMIIKGEFFDMRTVELIFKSNGVDTFKGIPFKYQLAMCRNLNQLIKFKSTSKGIVDICSIFGFDNVQVFNYYILKERKIDEDGNYIFLDKDVTDEDDNIYTVEDIAGEYELKFVKVPIGGSMDDTINSSEQIPTEDYDEVTLADKYWDGDMEHQAVKEGILNMEFNYLKSKYLSIDTLVSMTDLAFEMVYFYNMILDNHLYEADLEMNVPCINGIVKFKFIDVICYLFALMHDYNKTTDRVMDTVSKGMYIKGFNFKADMSTLASYIKEKGYTMEDLGISDFQTPDHVLTFDQMMAVFTKNANIYKHVVHELVNADNKQIYDIYKKIYDSLMINKLSDEFFTMSDGRIASTYTEFLKDKDILLYKSLMNIRNIDDESIREQKIIDMINNTIYYLEEYINSDEYKFLFSNLPSRTVDSMNEYLYRVIDFFKSYKVQIDKINTIYIFDDQLENKMTIIDDVIISHFLERDTVCEMNDMMLRKSILNYIESFEFKDRIFIDVETWIDKFLSTNIITKEEFINRVYTTKRDKLCINDSIYINSNIEFRDKINITDNVLITIFE